MQRSWVRTALVLATAILFAASTRVRADDGWKHYPYEASPGDKNFTFPAAEALHEADGADSWYLTGYLDSRTNGHRYSYVVIFVRNRITKGMVTLRADFYTLAFYDLVTGDYGQFSDYDFPPLNLLTSHKLTADSNHLQLSFNTSEGPASWTTRTDAHGNLIPFAYHLDVVGKDARGRPMHLVTDVDATKAPALAGGNDYRGVITHNGQKNTFEYQITRPLQRGTISWGNVKESVSGNIGHLDRQWFPEQIGGSLDPNLRKHLYSMIWLPDGTDLTVWDQFQMMEHDAPMNFRGLTVSAAGTGVTPTRYVSDSFIQPLSYVRWPIDQVKPLYSPPSKAIYFINRHRLVVPSMNLVLEGQWLVDKPALNLPVEYMEGPAHWTGFWNGKPIDAPGVWELTVGYYRDWELVEVLKNSLLGLPAGTFTGAGMYSTAGKMAEILNGVSTYIYQGKKPEARAYLEQQVAPALRTLAPRDRTNMQQIYNDLVGTLNNSSS